MFEVALAGRRIRASAILGLPVKTVDADRVVVIRDALVVALTLVERDEQQLRLPASQWQHTRLERGAASCRQPAHGREDFAHAIRRVQAQGDVFHPR